MDFAPAKRVQATFLTQLRAVFLKNFTLQARQRVSLAFQLIPLLGLLIAAAALAAVFPSPSFPTNGVPSCYSTNAPTCWDKRNSYSVYLRKFGPENYDLFWFSGDSSLIGTLPQNGSLGPSYDGLLGYTRQYDVTMKGWNITGNVPYFLNKSSFTAMYNEFTDRLGNLSVFGDDVPYWRCSPSYQPEPPYDKLCRATMKIPEAMYAFNKVESTNKGIHIDYSTVSVPTVGFNAFSMNVHETISLMNSMIYRWTSDIRGPDLNNAQITPTGKYLFFRSYTQPINAIVQICFWIIGIGLLVPFFMSKLVIERGSGLMEVSKMAGLSTTAYWSSIIIQDLIQILVVLLFSIIIGLSTGFLSLLHGGFVFYFSLFCFGLSVMSFSYLFSMLFKSVNWAYFFGYLAGLANASLCLPLNFLLFNGGELPQPYFLWYPPLAASRAIFVMIHTSEEPFILDYAKASTTAWICCGWSFGISCVLIVLSFLPDLIKEIIQSSTKNSSPIVPHFNNKDDEKIIIEEDPVDLEEGDSHKLLNDPTLPLRIQNVSKSFTNENGDVINAVNNVSFQIFKGDCFGLLGPNGAGKTTLVNMLVGLLDVTSGDAFVDGHSVVSDITGVQNSIGLCPQFDVHYDDLTVQEHLLYYSRLWGYGRSNERHHVKEIIQQIGLHDEKHRKASSLSGGQKRRLSIGIALSGNPPLVLLDEPSSGLDVGSQRAVWDIICNARKQQRSFLLTTHSMTEAEVLCNRIGIMSQGKLKVSGSPQHLKSKFGSGFKIDLSVESDMEEDMATHPATNFIRSILPQAELVSSQNGYLTFQVPKSTKLSKILTQIEIAKKPNRIINWGISQSNLQEVFLALTRGDNSGQGDNVGE